MGEFGPNAALLIGQQTVQIDSGLGRNRRDDLELQAADGRLLGTSPHEIIADPRYALGSQLARRDIFLSHGHLDHIGALPEYYKLETQQVTLHGAPFTLALFEKGDKLASDRYRKNKLAAGNYDIAGFNVSTIAMPHSMPHNLGSLWRDGAGRPVIMMTSDFRSVREDDFGPLTAPFNRACFIELLREKPPVIMVDSTNADTPGHAGTEADVQAALYPVSDQKLGLLVVANYGRNIERLITCLDVAKATGRELFISGKAAENALAAALAAGLIRPSQAAKIRPLSELEGYLGARRREVMLYGTGVQGEDGAMLDRLARGDVLKLPKGEVRVNLQSGDGVICSARQLQDEQTYMFKALRGLGVVLYTREKAPELYLSGHAKREDLCDLFGLIREHTPRSKILAAHGDMRQLQACAKLAGECGLHVLQNADGSLPQNGALIQIRGHNVVFADQVEVMPHASYMGQLHRAIPRGSVKPGTLQPDLEKAGVGGRLVFPVGGRFR
jgi:ribonuclease J